VRQWQYELLSWTNKDLWKIWRKKERTLLPNNHARLNTNIDNIYLDDRSIVIRSFQNNPEIKNQIPTPMRQGLGDKLKTLKCLNIKKWNCTYFAYYYSYPRGKDQKWNFPVWSIAWKQNCRWRRDVFLTTQRLCFCIRTCRWKCRGNS